MSIIRAIKHRLGLSVTPANNFVLDASADNGTMKLARESGQDIMTVDADGKVAFPQNAPAGGVPAGAVMDFAMTGAPDGWLLCNGAAVSRTTYAALFAAIGVVWGAGDGSTTFNVPSLAGQFRRTLGGAAGALGAIQAQQIGAHTHTYFLPAATSLGGTGSSVNAGANTSNNTGAASPGTGTVGSDNRPTNFAFQTCIKT